MPPMMNQRMILLILLWIGALGLVGCGGSNGQTTVTTSIAASVTPDPPTETPEPIVALVNGEPIRQKDFEQEVSRFETAQHTSGIDLATLGDYQVQILQALIDRLLLAQGARADGEEINEGTLNSRFQALAVELGGSEAMGAWLADNEYTLDGFKAALEEEMLAARMVERIVKDAPVSVEQVHARHILVGTREEAEDLLKQISAGANFDELARLFSRDPSTRPAGGDLSWFPRGYLLIPEVEEAAFALQVGEVSEVVESALGYHIVQTLEHANRPPAPEVQQNLRDQAVRDWLAAKREVAEIEILIAPAQNNQEAN